MKNTIFLGFLMSLFALFTSCEKVIEIDLEDADTQVVIEANLATGEAPFQVKISTTAPYFESGLPQAIEHATIRLLDENGNVYAVPHVQNGIYATLVNANVEQTYTLEVEIDGELYVAKSYLPAPVLLEEIYAEYQPAQGPLPEGYAVYFRYQDPANVANYYRAVHAVNGELQQKPDDLQVLNDRINDGALTLNGLLQQAFDLGDTVTVELRHFDETSYTYFSSLGDIIGGGMGPNSGSAAPGNPTTNWSNNALGYFSAYSSDSMTFRIEE